MRIPLLGMLAITGAIFFYGYIAYRYTSELVPALALAAAVGVVDLARRLEARPPRWPRIALGAMGVLAAFGFAANLAVAFHTSRINNPHELAAYVRVQEAVGDRTPGDPFDDLLRTGPTLPTTGDADELQIVGDCDGLYLGTGEPLWPWQLVEAQELEWEVDLRALPPGGPEAPVDVALAAPAELETADLVLRVEGDEVSATFDAELGAEGRGPRPVPEDGVLRLRLVLLLERAQYALVDVDEPDRPLAVIVATLPLPDGFRQQLLYRSEVTAPATVDGVRVTPVELPPLSYCEHLLESYGPPARS
jgi:hypothetical protein